MAHPSIVGFLEKLAAGETPELIQRGSRFIRTALREHAFTPKFLPTEHIDPAKCIPAKTHEGLSTYIRVEPKSKGVIMSWGAGPTSQEVTAGIAEIPFVIVGSPVFEKYQEQLLSYDYSITKVIEENSIRDIHERQDFQFLDLARQCVAQTGKIDTHNGTLDKAALKKGYELLDYDSRRTGGAAAILMSKAGGYNSLITQGNEFFGSQMAGEVFANGLRYKTLQGHDWVVSVKTHLLTSNPYAPSDKTAVAFNEDTGLPYDPFYNIGANLNGLLINGVAANGSYPASNIINGGVINALTATGSGAQTTIAVDGTSVTYVTYAGLDINATNSTRAWLGNTQFHFTRPDFLGKSYLLQDVNFFVKQEGRKISFESWINWACGIVNVNSVAMIVVKPTLV